MNPHPDFEGRPPPRSATVGSFQLCILSPEDVEEDYAAVVESEDVLFGLFDSEWPRGLTLERNLSDLKRHEGEFEAECAFAWIVRSSDGTYLGCAYLDPTPDVTGEGKVYTWIRDREDRLDILSRFNSSFGDWLGHHLPDGYSLTWTSNDDIGPSGA